MKNIAFAWMMVLGLVSVACLQATGQTSPSPLTVTGTVKATDMGDLGLPSVNVIEKGTYNGTVTDLDGAFMITVSSADAVLEVSYIGYLTEEVDVAGRSEIDVVLEPDVAGLEEAIVIGYGNQKRSQISGAVGKIGSKEITSVPVLRTEQALHAKVS